MEAPAEYYVEFQHNDRSNKEPNPSETIYFVNSLDNYTASSSMKFETEPHFKANLQESASNIQMKPTIEMKYETMDSRQQQSFENKADIVVLDMSWLPDFFNLSQIDESNVYGYVRTTTELQELLKIHADATTSRFYLRLVYFIVYF